MSSRSNTRAASLGFMFSYIVTRFLMRVASSSSLARTVSLICASSCLSWASRALEPLLGREHHALAHLELFGARLELGAPLAPAVPAPRARPATGCARHRAGPACPPGVGGGSLGARLWLSPSAPAWPAVGSATEPVTSGKLNICCAQERGGGAAGVSGSQRSGRRLGALLDRAGDVASSASQRVAAVEDQPRRFQDEQRADRDQHDRDEPEIAEQPVHAATGLMRSRRRSANDRAAAATAFGSGAVRGRGHVLRASGPRPRRATAASARRRRPRPGDRARRSSARRP